MSFDHEAAVAQALAFLGQGLAAAFEADARKVFAEHRIEFAAPKSFQRMQNKLLNPAEHGDPSLPRPRCYKNVDVLRGCVIAKSVEELEAIYAKLQKAFTVARVKNTHNPDTDGWRGGYRSILVNFFYEPGITWGQLFGDKVAYDFRDNNRFGFAGGERHVTPIAEGQNHL